jgi:hypothetical protein
MNRRRLFISKAMRPDITKPVSDRIYYDDCLSAPGNADEQSMYPGVSLKGCSKDGSDGKEGSDGVESFLPTDAFILVEDLSSTRFVNLGERFRPQLQGANPGAAIKIAVAAQ